MRCGCSACRAFAERTEVESLYLLIPVSVILVFIIGILFWWSLRNGQYDDLEGPAYRLLLDDRDEPPGSQADQASPDAHRKPDEGSREIR